MFAKISYGDRMSGLMTYLVGPGRANEHTEPHLVAGDPALLAWHDDNELSKGSGFAIARHLDRPHKAHGVERKGGHVFHCSLSVAAEEGELGDQRWQDVAEAFVEKMGLDGQEGTKSPTRWVAVHHGQSTNGNDHVHVVLNLVREDGTKASVHKDRIKARDACRELEKQFGLQQLESEGRGRASVPYAYPERQAAARRSARGEHEQARTGNPDTVAWHQLPASERVERVDEKVSHDQPRWALARTVRACATASVDEAEFVRRLRGEGVWVRPRMADGRDDVVVGYSVAQKPAYGEKPIWYGGGRLAKDLTLPRLRAEWPDTPAGASQAAAEWTAAKRGKPSVTAGRETHTPEPGEWKHVQARLDELREQLRSIPIDDKDTWARVARDTAGVLSAWSRSTEGDTPGPFAATADALARSAETTRPPARRRTALPTAAGTAFLMLAAAKPGAAGQLALLKSVANLTKAVHDMHRAEGAAKRAHQIEAAVRTQLVTVSSRLDDQVKAEIAALDPQAAEAAQRARQGQQPRAPARPDTPVPNQLPERERPRTVTPQTGPQRREVDRD